MPWGNQDGGLHVGSGQLLFGLRTFFFHMFFTGSWNGCLLLNWTFLVQPHITMENLPQIFLLGSSQDLPRLHVWPARSSPVGSWLPCTPGMGLGLQVWQHPRVAHGFAHLSFALHLCKVLPWPQHSVATMLSCLTVHSLLPVVLIKTKGQMLFQRLLIICFIYCWYGKQRNLWSITSCSIHCCAVVWV